MQSDGDSHFNLAAINVGGAVKPAAVADQDDWDQGAMTVLTRCDVGTQVRRDTLGISTHLIHYIYLKVNFHTTLNIVVRFTCIFIFAGICSKQARLFGTFWLQTKRTSGQQLPWLPGFDNLASDDALLTDTTYWTLANDSVIILIVPSACVKMSFLQ